MAFCFKNGPDTTVTKNCSSDSEKLLKFKSEGMIFSKFLRSLLLFIWRLKGQYNFFNRTVFLFVPGSFSDLMNLEYKLGKKNGDLETYRKSFSM